MKECLLFNYEWESSIISHHINFDMHSDNFVFLTKIRDIEILLWKKLLKCKERGEVRITLQTSLFGV